MKKLFIHIFNKGITPPPNPLPHGAGGQDTPSATPLSPCGRVEIPDFGEGAM